jgi:hypothetical protein
MTLRCHSYRQEKSYGLPHAFPGLFNGYLSIISFIDTGIEQPGGVIRILISKGFFSSVKKIPAIEKRIKQGERRKFVEMPLPFFGRFISFSMST